MMTSTYNVVKTMLDQDMTINMGLKVKILQLLSGKDHEKKPITKRIVSRAEIAKRAGRSVKWVDKFNREHPGVFKKVRMLGSDRGFGFTSDSVEAFFSGESLGLQRNDTQRQEPAAATMPDAALPVAEMTGS